MCCKHSRGKRLSWGEEVLQHDSSGSVSFSLELTQEVSNMKEGLSFIAFMKDEQI